MARVLRIDLETYSDYDLKEVGVYKYVESPNFEILMIGYAYDNGLVDIIDLMEGTCSANNLAYEELEWLKEDLQDPSIIKKAFNANFEITALSKYFNIDLDPSEWRCTAVHALQMGLPGNLAGVAKALGLDEQKDTKGKALINYFSKPCKPTKTNGGRTRNLPEHDPEKWQEFKDYCIQDVVVEREIDMRLAKYPVPDAEWRLWAIDQQINRTGVLIDTDLVNGAVAIAQDYTNQLMERAKEITGLDNPNSLQQLKGWLEDNEGIEITGLTKDDVKELLKDKLSDEAREVLMIRQELGKTSVAKYQAMQRAVCEDGRVRGLLQFYGANRTGRWAGRLIQVQNLTKHKIGDVDAARDAVTMGDADFIDILYGNAQDLLSQLVRTALIAPKGHRFIVSDFSAIEARVIAWLAGEQWRLDVFQTHGKIYEASAAQMFRVPIESIDKHSPLRQKGKVAELALGYQGGPNALISMGALKMGLNEDELKPLVDAWRNANLKIVKLWADLEEYAINAISSGKTLRYKYGIEFKYESRCLFIKLPSGRSLCYQRARLEPDPRFNRQVITYWGTDSKGWTKLSTYGGKLTENLVQAIARDCLAENGIIKLHDKGYKINLHVHDEVVIEVRYGVSSKEEVMRLMSESISWAPGLPLNADAYETEYYKKD